MDNKQLENFKNQFENMIQKHTYEALKEEFLANSKGDSVDVALEEREKLLFLKLNGRQDFFIKKVKGALERIENGTFGQCEDCGDNISLTRLQARPTATMCINCKEEQEREENHVPYEKKSHTLGKEIKNANVTNVRFTEQAGGEKVVGYN